LNEPAIEVLESQAGVREMAHAPFEPAFFALLRAKEGVKKSGMNDQ
jgi:hypothetical protein